MTNTLSEEDLKLIEVRLRKRYPTAFDGSDPITRDDALHPHAADHVLVIALLQNRPSPLTGSPEVKGLRGLQEDLDLLGGLVLHLEEGAALKVGDPLALAACLRRVLTAGFPGSPKGSDAATTDALFLQAHDALEAARDKMRGVVDPDDEAVYAQVTEALYALRSRPAIAAAEAKGSGVGR